MQSYDKPSINPSNLAESLIKSQPGLFVLFDKKGRLHWWNTQLEIYSGYSADQIKYLRLLDFVDDHDKEDVRSTIHKAFLQGITDVEMRLKGNKDDTTEFLLTWVAIEIEGVDYIIASGIDITKLKEERRQKERYYQVLEKSRNEILMYDADSLKLIYVNKGARKNLGYSLDQLNQMKVYDIKPGFNENSFREHIHPLVERQVDQLVYQTYHQRKDGSRYDVEIKLELEESDDQNILVGIATDITDRLAKEQLIRDSLREKELLLGEVHHRVKNNLAIVSSLLNMQAANVKSEALKSIFKDNVNRVMSMTIIHQMLYEQDSFSDIDFGEYLKKLIKVIESNYRSLNSKISSEVDAGNISFNISQAVPISLIVNELITNAYKHGCDENSICTVKVSVTRKSGINTLVVSDNGHGLPSEFDIEESTGLGMVLVRGLTDQLGGKLDVSRNGGTSFVITFKSDSPRTI